MSDEPNHEGIDFALEQLCTFLGVDPHMVSWDAATETVDGDVNAVIGNIMRAKYGEDFDPKAGPAATPPSGSAVAMREALKPFANISLIRDADPGALNDMIDGPDLAITPKDVRRARAALAAKED